MSLESKPRAPAVWAEPDFNDQAPSDQAPSDFDATKITRPDDALLSYYLIISLLSTIAFPWVFIPLWIRFKTLRYRFDEQGVSMCWGFVFRREVHLTYARIQDIHVTRNILERWLGLAKLPIQTASGAAGATMSLEGIRNPNQLRNFLYLRMRDVNDETQEDPNLEASSTVLLREIRDELRQQRDRAKASP